ncbi:hypothetical protein CLV55_103200 [Flavobacterium aciduliphilum]|jgi:hypothetical protein|uniref:Uncharacterized protein n=1 Tax=Flavobacterium aciduliphilum TaxID=1101402 RepID=A0A328YK37_9FLAO|nr:hypothetical protein CLV55_103200 [Flavobacterium aciduliphilum]
MKINNKTIIYSYALGLFVLTYLFVSKLISGFKNKDYDYLRLAINLGLIIYIIIKVIKLGRLENDKKE